MMDFGTPSVIDIWKDDDLLVVQLGATFPERCIVCDEATTTKPITCSARKQLTTDDKAHINPFFQWFISKSQSASLNPHLCMLHRSKELKGRWITRMIFIIAVIGMITPFACILLFGFLLIFVGIIFDALRWRPLKAYQLDRHFVWLMGVPQTLIDEYPDAPIE